ncbi:TPA: hypothetical protein NJY97_005254 [Vibrio parahaemolyticus]|nr:hypothetical protein [Vibrio parahaemolyticus]MDG2677705.1 hypothetical protein [Vibrio parahaemolyticus]HCE1608079.1 hypothetical protein [Vibrio parahaemolyticus]HCE5231183.1 hypothetical protein [Vibrio parahaemolyticus]HCE5233145.1 hypothetical protein [Vibrio parahaemolyticus]
MKFRHLRSKDLPSIDETAKRCINSGQWFLFKTPISSQTRAVAYCLKIDQEVYSLDSSGKPIGLLKIENEIVMEELFYFDDIESPSSLSNQLMA